MSEARPDIWEFLRRAFQKITAPWLGSAHPMELRRAVLDDVARDLVAVREEQKIYPYNYLSIRLLGETPRERAVLEATLVEGDRLAEAVRQRLADQGCAVADLAIKVAVTGERTKAFGEQRFAVHKRRRAPDPGATPATAPPPAAPLARLTVVRGTADKKTYTLDQDLIAVGRLREVTDEHGRLRRRNHVAFTEEDEESRSVSREHARIVRRDGEFRVIDDRSAAGTQIFRGGRTIPVSSRDRRGIRLRPGDLVYFGRAALGFDQREPQVAEADES